MSKKQGLFDAAIKILRDSAIRLRAFNIKPNDINFAIRILEVAGKVDKRDAVHTISLLAENWYETSGEYGEGSDVESNEIMKPSVENIRALLEVLPDKEE